MILRPGLLAHQNPISSKAVLVFTAFVLLFTFFQYYLVFLVSQYGENRFYDFGEHIDSVVRGMSSLLATLISLRWVGRTMGKSSSVVLIFLASSLLFLLFVTAAYLVRRTFLCNIPTSADMLFGNAVMSFFFYQVAISAIVIAWFYFYKHLEERHIAARSVSEKRLLELKVLQKHIEPHFLFNNLSVLASLIRNEDDIAQKFIHHFAELYRHILRHQVNDVVCLHEELDFISHYFYLIKQRFGDAYEMRVDKSVDTSRYLPPAALHSIIENVVKHNAANSAQPLVIQIGQEDDYLVIRNLKVLKSHIPAIGSGLENLQKRYSNLIDKEVVVIDLPTEFIVKLPLLNIQNDEDSNT